MSPNPTIIVPFEAANPSGVTITVPLGFEATCDAGVSVGDPVILSTAIDLHVEKLTSNTYDVRLVVGIVSEKPTSTSAIVVVAGILPSIGSGFDRGKAVWVSPTGGLTTTKPLTGHLQVVGMSISSVGMNVNIQAQKVIQV